MLSLPSIDFVANSLQSSGDCKIVLPDGPKSGEAREAVDLLLGAAKLIGLHDEQILLTVTAREARLQALPGVA